MIHALRQLLQQPLLHFLGLGLLIFVAYEALNDEPGERDILLDHEALLTFMQYRSRAFDRARAEAEWAAMDAAARDALVADWLREEVLYREAVAMELDRGDYVIRQRLVQKLEFIANGLAEEPAPLTQAEVQAYYEAHRADYQQPAQITFTHVFFDRARGESAARLAGETLAQLRQQSVSYAGALGLGDRYPFHQNYVARDREFIAAQFDPAFADALFSDQLPLDSWQGPFSSPYGEHLVLISGRLAAHTPALAEMYELVAEQAQQARGRAQLDQAIAAILARYQLVRAQDRS